VRVAQALCRVFEGPPPGDRLLERLGRRRIVFELGEEAACCRVSPSVSIRVLVAALPAMVRTASTVGRAMAVRLTI